MAKRIAPIRVISFCLLAACGAWCQSERADLVQGLQLDGLPVSRMFLAGECNPAERFIHQPTRRQSNSCSADSIRP